MALYWVGGTGNWSDATNHWATTSGGAPGAGNLPTATDDVFFDSASNATAYTVTIDATTKLCRDITFAAPASGNVTWAGSVGMTVSGSMTLYSGLIASYTGGITFNATSTGKTITMAGVTSLAPGTSWSFNGVGGGWTFQDTFTLGGNQQHTLLAGTLDMNGQTVNISAFRSNGSGTRTLTMGSATITLSTTNQVAFEFTGSGYTVTANTASITTTTTSTAPFNGGGKTYYNVTVDKSASTTNTEFQNTTGDTFNNLTIKSGNAKTVTCKFYGNNTINGILTINGNSSINRILVQSDTKGTARTLTAATVTVTNADFQDITGAGAGSWNLSAITGNSGDCGGNSGITFTTQVTTNWTSGATWSTATWSSRVPLPQDTATFTTAGVATITQDMPRIGSVDFSTSADKTWTTSTICSVFGSINLTNLATLTASTQTYTFEGRGSTTINNGGFTWEKPIIINNVTGTITLTATFTTGSTRAFTLTTGIFDINGNTFSIGNFNSNQTNTRTLKDTAATGAITLTGSGTVIWSCGDANNFTLTTLPTIVCNYSGGTGTRSIFNASSTGTTTPSFNITAGTDICSIAGKFGSFNFTGFAGTLSDQGLNSSLSGDLTIPVGVTVATWTSTLSFVATSGTKTITSGVTLNFPVTINGSGGIFQLGGNLTMGATQRLIVTLGTFTCVNGASNYVLSTGLFSMGGGTTTLGSATHLITGTGTTTWNVTGGTLTASTGTIKFTDTATATGITFVGGGKTYNNVWFARGTNTQSNTITGSNTFADFKDDGSVAHSLLFTAGTTQTVTTFTVSGTAGNLITINSTTTATHALVKSGGGTISCNYLNIQHSVATPSSTWYAGTNSTDNQAVATAGSGWIFTAPPGGISTGGLLMFF